MNRRRYLGLTTAVALPLVGGCVGRDLDEVRARTEAETTTDSGPETTAGTPTNETVTIGEEKFDPSDLAVPAGSTVEWVNESGGEVHVRNYQYSDDAVEWPLDATLAAGNTTSFTFDEAGIYQYYSVEAGTFSMCGMVRVGGATTAWGGTCL